MRTVPVQQANRDSNGLLLDVRTPAEFEEMHAESAVLHPLSDLRAPKVAELAANRTIYVVCRTGSRAVQAAERLQREGVSNVAVVDGGMQAWEAAGLPVLRGRKAISLERQVRIAAGSLVLLGAILGFTVHTGFFALCAFVGGGLVFAGITDWCGMGMLLARMPWNNRACSANRCSGAAAQLKLWKPAEK